MSLQPHFTFREEATRLNQLYWMSRYSFRFLAARSPSKATSALTATAEEKRNLKLPVPQARLLRSLRVAAVLHVCSAFEHAVVSNFALCILYQPSAFKKTRQLSPLPSLLADAQSLQTARGLAGTIADGMMGGDYTTRLKLFGSRFGVDVSWVDAQLDAHQKTRHMVAHDQALDGPDDPAPSSPEVITASATLTESEWKAMLGPFSKTIDHLDDEVARTIVTDHGLSLAVYRTIERDPAATYDDVLRAVLNEWRIPATNRPKCEILYHLGLVEQGRRKKQAARSYYRQSLALRPHADVQAALDALGK